MNRPSRITIALVAAELLLLLSLVAGGLISWRIGGPHATGLLAFTLLRVLVIALVAVVVLLVVACGGMAMLCAWSITRSQRLAAPTAFVVAHSGSAGAPLISVLHALTKMLLTWAGKQTAALLVGDLFDHLLTASQAAKAPLLDQQTSDTPAPPPQAQTPHPAQGSEPWEHTPAFTGAVPPSIALEYADPPPWHGPAAWFTGEEQATREPAQQGSALTHKKRLTIGLLTLLLMVVVMGLFPFLSAAPPSPLSLAAPATSMGMLSFGSSGQLDPLGTTGTQDMVTLTLSHLATPPKGMEEVAWLLPERTDDGTVPLFLGPLPVASGSAHLEYRQPDHRNLLARYSRVVITAEEVGHTPVMPSLDPAHLLATGAIPDTPTPGDEKQYSLLSHLRHLLASDPTLQAIGLFGGLDIWLYRNSGKLVEYTTAARDGWPDQSQNGTDLLRRQVIRTLDELDGATQVSQDVPAGTPLLIDPKAGHIGLLQITPAQDPPGYLAHVDVHLQGLASAPGHTAAQHDLAISLDQATNTIMAELAQVRQDGMHLVQMDNNALHQPQALTLLNDMVMQTTAADIGTPDPMTGATTGGVTWIHATIQGLATVPVTLTAHQ